MGKPNRLFPFASMLWKRRSANPPKRLQLRATRETGSFGQVNPGTAPTSSSLQAIITHMGTPAALWLFDMPSATSAPCRQQPCCVSATMIAPAKPQRSRIHSSWETAVLLSIGCEDNGVA
ncbi:uncharacterized protein ACIBXB_003803 isoform 1-T3 [Morphnus guianensis]